MNPIDAERREQIAKVVEFAEKANEVCERAGIEYEFECPLCHNIAFAEKVEEGHVYGHCLTCNISFC